MSIVTFLLLPNSTDATAENRVRATCYNVVRREQSVAGALLVRFTYSPTEFKMVVAVDRRPGKDKVVGGDEYYVTYSDNVEYSAISQTRATAVAFITDIQMAPTY
jgi:hypothetical protein